MHYTSNQPLSVAYTIYQAGGLAGIVNATFPHAPQKIKNTQNHEEFVCILGKISKLTTHGKIPYVW